MWFSGCLVYLIRLVDMAGFPQTAAALLKGTNHENTFQVGRFRLRRRTGRQRAHHRASAGPVFGRAGRLFGLAHRIAAFYRRITGQDRKTAEALTGRMLPETFWQDHADAYQAGHTNQARTAYQNRIGQPETALLHRIQRQLGQNAHYIGCLRTA